MASTTTVNDRTVVHRGSDGVSATFPDVCLTPAPGGPAPVPYPNVARSADLVRGTGTVTVDGHPVAVKGSAFGRSTGDEPGTQKGVISQAVGGEARFQNWSFDVVIEGRNACRLLDPMANNGGSPTNTPPIAELQPPRRGRAPDPDDKHRHVVRVTFRYAQPMVWTDHDPAPRIGVAYELAGDEDEIWSPLFRYTSGYSYVWEPGAYRLTMRPFDLERRALLSGDRAAQLAARPHPVLVRVMVALEAIGQDLEDVAEGYGRDLWQILVDLGAVDRYNAIMSNYRASIAALLDSMEAVQRAIYATSPAEVGEAALDALVSVSEMLVHQGFTLYHATVGAVGAIRQSRRFARRVAIANERLQVRLDRVADDLSMVIWVSTIDAALEAAEGVGDYVTDAYRESTE